MFAVPNTPCLLVTTEPIRVPMTFSATVPRINKLQPYIPPIDSRGIPMITAAQLANRNWPAGVASPYPTSTVIHYNRSVF